MTALMFSAEADFHGRKVLILGVGILGGGISMARYCHAHGAILRITDLREPCQLQPAIEALSDIGVEFVLGRHREEDIDWADIVVRNPGVPPDHPLLARAKAQGKAIEMEMSCFVRNCTAKLFAVTGTKGKTTTTTILHQFLQASGSDVALAGNMGVSAIRLLDQLRPEDEVLLEISCFQLEGMLDHPGAIDVAIITNVEDDHLDRYHHSLADYRKVKASIGKGQSGDDWLILPAWDRELACLCNCFPSHKIYVNKVGHIWPPYQWTQSDVNVFILDSKVIWHSPTGSQELIADIDGLTLLGSHNRVNAAFAASAAHIAGRTASQISETVKSIVPVAHRLESIGRANGVEFINDSAATAPIAVVAALDALATNGPVVISGGDDKGADRTLMLKSLQDAEAPVILLPGSATSSLRADLAAMKYRYPVSLVANMSEAVEQAFRFAISDQGRDVVLLSPGFCSHSPSSHSVFVNEFDRGMQFRNAAERIILNKTTKLGSKRCVCVPVSDGWLCFPRYCS